MAGNQVNVNLSVTDQGGTLKRRNREAQQLNETLTSAAKSAKNAMAPASRIMGEGTEYGRARGTVGSTGAEARDFANQAQGLGGLVRVYATVAANLFAATAAFNALKEAANTAGMIKGLDQLGAASGVALGTLSKQFVSATGEAISLREAMGSVARATAAGLSTQQILDIGKYAKTASQALGVDMTDAVNRLTRGIVKLEPELLDELGLFTKIGPATENYARSVGKTAASLTDFERRQAFANAVLQEAKDKFGQLELDANPYQQLEASIRNLATAGLALVNEVLAPIVKLFANNSVLLTAALGGIALKLTKMAIPALLQWRTTLVQSAQAAKEKARDINELFGEREFKQTALQLNIPQLEKDLARAKAKVLKTQEEIFYAEQNSGLKRKAGTLAQTATFGQDPKDFEKSLRTAAELGKKNTAEANAYSQALRDNVKATRELLSAQQALNIALEQEEKTRSIGGTVRGRISQQAGARSERLTILSQVSENVERGGFKYAMSEVEKGVNKAADLSAWDKLRTKATAWAIAGTSQIGLFVRAFSSVFSIIGTGLFVFSVLESMYSKNTKQLQEFTGAVDSNKVSIETNIATLKKYGNELNITALAAKAVSFKQLGEDIEALSDKMLRVIQERGTIDIFTNWFKGLFGFSIQDEFAESIGKNIAQQLENIPEGPSKEALKQKLLSIFGTATLSAKEITQLLKSDTESNVRELAQKAQRELKPFITRQLEIAEAGKKVEEALKTSNIRAQELIQSLAINDPVLKLGDSLIVLGSSLLEAGKASESTSASIKKLIQSTDNIRVISPENFNTLLQVSKLYDTTYNNVQKYSNELEVVNTRIAEQQRELARWQDSAQEGAKEIREELNRLISLNFGEQRILKVKIEADKSTLKTFDTQLEQIAKESVGKGLDLIFKQSGFAAQLARIGTSRNLLQGVVSPGAIRAEANLALQEVELRKEQISITAKLNETMIINNGLQQARAFRDQAENIRQEAEKKNRELTGDEGKRIGELIGQALDIEKVVGTKNLTQNFLKQFEPGAALQLGTALSQATRASSTAKSQEIEKARQIEDQARINQLRAQQNILVESLNAQKSAVTLRQQESALLLDNLNYLTDAQLAEKQAAQTKATSLANQIEAQQVANDIAVATKKQELAIPVELKKAFGEEIALFEQRQKLLKEQQEIQGRILQIQEEQFRISNAAKRTEFERAQATKITEQRERLALDVLTVDQELSAVRSQILLKSEDQIKAEEKSFLLRKTQLEFENSTAQLQRNKIKEVDQLLTQRNLALAAAQGDPLIQNQLVLQYDNLQKAALAYYDNELAALNRNKLVREQTIDLQFSMTTRMIAYDDILRKSFDNMADAMVEFTKTGKINFKDMINSMLADLLRFELRQQYMGTYRNIGGIQGIFNMLGFGTGQGAGTAGSVAGTSIVPDGKGGVTMALAKGSVFGVERFAKGGMFSNKIVSQPTLFKFAQGTGLMGEAGPEAVMPLKRDHTGTLGVRSTQPRVDVVVNNYTTQVAETRETVDSRGNRKIEVVIGDMVAGELGRKNSAVQQSMQQNFQAKPSMVRR